MIDIVEGEDFYNDKIYFNQDEKTQSFINNLKKNLKEKSLYTQLFNNYKFEKIMMDEEMKKEDITDKKDQKKSMNIEQKEQIDEVKINMFMILFNECDKDDSEKGKYPYIDNNNIVTRRLIIEECIIKDSKLIVNKKDYVFIPIRTSPIFHYGNEEIEIDTKIKRSPVLKINKSEVWNEENFKKLYKEQLTKEIEYLDEHKKSTTKSNSGQNFSLKTDNSEGEINGKRFYFKIDENNIRRYIYTNDYKKEIDGFYTKHKKIDLGIKGKVELKIESDINFDDYLKEHYNINNNLKAHILYKNFVEEVIPENEPIIIEVKKSFKLYDLLNQIKQISKVSKNLSLNTKENNGISSFPKYIIGYLCNFTDSEVKNQNIQILKGKYKDTNKNLLQHNLEVIDNNNVNVIICLIKDEKIMGYDLSIEDYNNKEGKEITKRVDLNYLCEKIFPNKNKTDLIKLVMNKYKNKYESLTYEGEMTMSKHYQEIKKIKNEYNAENEKLKDENQSVKAENKAVKDENKVVKDENQEYKATIEKLNDENKAVKAENQAVKDENKAVKAENQAVKDENQAVKDENKAVKGENQEYKATIEKLNDKYKAVKDENQEYKTTIEKLNDKNKRILDDYEKLKREFERLKNSSQQKNNLNNGNE